MSRTARALCERESAESRRESEFEALVKENRERFFAYALHECGNAADAEDLLSESLLEAFQAFDSYQGYGFDRWVFRILTTNRIDQARRARRRPVVSVAEVPEVLNWSENPLEKLILPLFSDEVVRALRAVPTPLRLPLLLCDYEGLSYAAAACRLNVPIGTVRSRIHRARERLHLELRAFCRLKNCSICSQSPRRSARELCRSYSRGRILRSESASIP